SVPRDMCVVKLKLRSTCRRGSSVHCAAIVFRELRSTRFTLYITDEPRSTCTLGCDPTGI
ncbi:MAG: hypothetical protein ABIN58_03955, partial [candidate division WOR-3 bacterium]